MVDVPLVITILLSLILIVLALMALLRNPGEALNRQFFAFALSTSIWLVVNYIAADDSVEPRVALYSNRFVLVAGGASILFMLGFIIRLTAWRHMTSVYLSFLAVNVVTWVACLTPLVVSAISFQNEQVINEFGPLAFMYFLVLFMTFIASVIVLSIGHFKLRGIRRTQLDAISRSVLTAVPVVLLCNAILPIFGYYGAVAIAPAALSIIVFTMFYTIAKHHLFNIRILVIRSLGYVLSLGLLSIFYGLAIHYIAVTFERQYASQIWSDVLNAALITFVAVAYQPLKARFDRFTNKIFYKDAYDPQVFLDRLNQVIVSNIDTHSLIKGAVGVINQNLKSEFCVVGLRETGYFPGRVLGDAHPGIAESDVDAMRVMLARTHMRVVIADEISNDYPSLARVMRNNNIALLAKLVTTLKYDVEGIGYLALGDKKSGNPYSKQDAKIVEIVANELVIAVQNALRFEEIENFNVTLQQKVEDAIARLKRANEKLTQIDETKDEFISMASHQLRTPLTSVKGYLSMVLEGDVGELNDMQRKMLNQAFVSSQRMVYLIADLLNLSRLRTGKFVIDAIPTNLDEVIKSEIDQLRETAASHSLELVYHSPDVFPVFMLDETKIRQVLMNFIDNAIYYTPSGGKIVVALRETAQTIEFTVTDNGIGVPRAEQPHLFTKFYRASNARGARPDGTGLGLFMAKKVIVAQGGAVIFKSTEGHGSTFGFSFAKAKLQIPPPKQKEQTANG